MRDGIFNVVTSPVFMASLHSAVLPFYQLKKSGVNWCQLVSSKTNDEAL